MFASCVGMLLTHTPGFLLSAEYLSDQIPTACEKLSRHFTADGASQYVYMHRTVFYIPCLLTSSSANQSWKFTVSFSEGSYYFYLSFHFSAKGRIPSYREFWGKEENKLLKCFFPFQHERQYLFFFSFISGVIDLPFQYHNFCSFYSTIHLSSA